MATITSVTMGREGHYRYLPLTPGTSTMQAAECECGATWTHGSPNSAWDTFCDWAINHPKPTVVRATVQCAGGLIRVEAVDGNGVGWCHACQRYRPTSPQPGYEGWHQFDPHPVYVAVKP